jgi:methionyl-tRNA formyltransferase
MNNDFKVAIFSDPPVSMWILPKVLSSGLRIASWTSVVQAGPARPPSDPFCEALASSGIPFLQPSTIRGEEFKQSLLATNPSVLASLNFARKLPDDLLEAVPFGGVNCHPSMLPAYRGALPYFWSICNGDASTGVTIHKTTNEFDAGDIYAARPVTMTPSDTSGLLALRCTQAGIDLLIEVLKELALHGTMPAQPQDHSKASRAPAPDAGVLQIDWSRSVTEIERLIRAGSPMWGAFTLFRQTMLRIWSATIGGPNPKRVPPGSLRLRDGSIEIACSDGFLRPNVMQLDILRFFSAEEFPAFFQLHPDERVG